MFQIEVTDRWHDTFSGGHVGVLLIGNVEAISKTLGPCYISEPGEGLSEQFTK